VIRFAKSCIFFKGLRLDTRDQPLPVNSLPSLSPDYRHWSFGIVNIVTFSHDHAHYQSRLVKTGHYQLYFNLFCHVFSVFLIKRHVNKLKDTIIFGCKEGNREASQLILKISEAECSFATNFRTFVWTKKVFLGNTFHLRRNETKNFLTIKKLVTAKGQQKVGQIF
jgi:hypothetical protein